MLFITYFMLYSFYVILTFPVRRCKKYQLFATLPPFFSRFFSFYVFFCKLFLETFSGLTYHFRIIALFTHLWNNDCRSWDTHCLHTASAVSAAARSGDHQRQTCDTPGVVIQDSPRMSCWKETLREEKAF